MKKFYYLLLILFVVFCEKKFYYGDTGIPSDYKDNIIYSTSTPFDGVWYEEETCNRIIIESECFKETNRVILIIETYIRIITGYPNPLTFKEEFDGYCLEGCFPEYAKKEYLYTEIIGLKRLTIDSEDFNLYFFRFSIGTFKLYPPTSANQLRLNFTLSTDENPLFKKRVFYKFCND